MLYNVTQSTSGSRALLRWLEVLDRTAVSSVILRYRDEIGIPLRGFQGSKEEKAWWRSNHPNTWRAYQRDCLQLAQSSPVTWTEERPETFSIPQTDVESLLRVFHERLAPKIATPLSPEQFLQSIGDNDERFAPQYAYHLWKNGLTQIAYRDMEAEITKHGYDLVSVLPLFLTSLYFDLPACELAYPGITSIDILPDLHRRGLRFGNINTDERVMIIAEIGNNHEGSFTLAEEMIGRAAEAGAHAAKFQTIVPERFVRASQTERMAQLKRYEFSYEEYTKLKAVADREGIAFLSTPYDLESVAFLRDIMSVVKVGSGDNNFYALLEVIAASGKPIMMSTGLADMTQLKRSTNVIESAWSDRGVRGELALLHCVSSYPTPSEQANLRAITTLRDAFPRYTIGYSDHTLGIEAAVASVALGARIIEKHFTIDKNYSDFRDHQLSADPRDMKELTRRVRELEVMLGTGAMDLQPGEAKIKEACRRSIVAARDLPAGTTVSREDITWMRPGDGLAPGSEGLVIGQTLAHQVVAGEIIQPM